MPEEKATKPPLPVQTLDEIYQEIGYCRIKGEDDATFKRRVANRVDQEKWVEIASRAQKRIGEIIGDGPDTDAAEMAALRTALEYAAGSPKQKVELSGPDGQPLAFGFVPVTQEQIDRFVEHYAKPGSPEPAA